MNHPKVRNRFDRRLIDRRGRTPREIYFAITCAEADARFVGVQPGVEAAGLEDIVLFNDSWGSTCGLFASQFSPEAVREKVLASNEKWRSSHGNSGAAND